MPTYPQSDPWQENLKALQAVEASLADRLRDLTIPSAVQPAVGRDDHPTFRIQNPAGTSTWFGRTSMPTISAEGLLRQFNAGSGNVAIAGIGSGLEAKLLSERLGRHRATFVLETAPLNLALALRLWDMSAGLRNHQIILLLADDLLSLGERLTQMCLSNPGLEPPARMLAWPWRTKAENQPWQNLLEEAARQVNRSCNACLAQQIDRLRQSSKPGATPQAVAVLTTASGPLTGRAVEVLAEGACAAGFDIAKSWPDSPRRAGPLAGLIAAGEMAGRGETTQIVLIDQCRNHWPLQDLPGPLISWLVAVEPTNEAFQPTLGKQDWAVASTARQREQLQALGWPAERVLDALPFVSPKAFEEPAGCHGHAVCDHGTSRSRISLDSGHHRHSKDSMAAHDAAMAPGWPAERVLDALPFVSPKVFAGPDDRPREGIVLLHDLVPEDPEQAGVTLYSHKVLWQALRDRLNREPDAWQPAEALRWLIGAQTTTGTDLSDPAVQEQFAGAVQRYLAPSVILSRAAKAILAAGLPLRIWGRGWDKLDWAKAAGGPVDDLQARADLLQRAQVVILGDIRPGQAWLALEAAAAGPAIMARSLWPDGDPAKLLSPKDEMLVWAGQQQLIERLRYVLRNDAARVQMTRQARNRALEEHSAGVRLRQVMDAIRKLT